MTSFNRPQSLAAVAEAASDAEAFSFALRNFLDAFYAAPSADRLTDEPQRLAAALSDDGLADSYVAALAEHLARQFRFQKPEWVRSPDRTMKKPWFSMRSHAGRMFLLTESPASFRQRNIFISADALSRA